MDGRVITERALVLVSGVPARPAGPVVDRAVERIEHGPGTDRTLRWAGPAAAPRGTLLDRYA
jgi:hypothetical protein